MWPFRPAWKSKNSIKAVGAIQKLVSPAKLERAAQEAECWQARVAAVEKITNQTVLARVATDDQNRFVRVVAAGKLTDEALAREVCEPFVDCHMSLISTPTWKIVQEAYAHFASKDRGDGICCAACEKVTDQFTLGFLAVYSDSEQVCRMALERLADQESLWFVAGSDSNLRMEAYAKLNNDEKGYAKVAQNTKWEDIFTAALEKVTDEALISQILILKERHQCNSGIKKQLMAALRKISNKSLLTEIVLSANMDWVRYAAAKKLDDPKMREILCKNGFHEEREIDSEDFRDSGETRRFYTVYRCIYCGEKWEEMTDSYRL